MRDKSMTGKGRKAWRKRFGHELTDEEGMLRSRIGKRMTAYFAKLVELGVVDEVSDQV